MLAFCASAPLPLNHLKESDTQSYVFNLLSQCRKARFESKFITRMRFYHLDFVLFIFIDWISHFHLPFCLQSHLIFCNNSFLISTLPRWTGRNMCPSAVRGIGFLHGNCQALFFLSIPPWRFVLFPGIVYLFQPTWKFILLPGIFRQRDSK